jgi:hypothetical protein
LNLVLITPLQSELVAQEVQLRLQPMVLTQYFRLLLLLVVEGLLDTFTVVLPVVQVVVVVQAEQVEQVTHLLPHHLKVTTVLTAKL